MSAYTDAEITQLRDLIVKALGLPRPNVACIFIVAESGDDGDSYRVGCIGLTTEGVPYVLNQALRTVLSEQPEVVVTDLRVGPGN